MAQRTRGLLRAKLKARVYLAMLWLALLQRLSEKQLANRLVRDLGNLQPVKLASEQMRWLDWCDLGCQPD